MISKRGRRVNILNGVTGNSILVENRTLLICSIINKDVNIRANVVDKFLILKIAEASIEMPEI